MPERIAVELHDHDPGWAVVAKQEAARIAPGFGDHLVRIHHIGSTAIQGIMAKPILDLMPEVSELDSLDEVRPQLEALGYEWFGEYGIPGRRYLKRDDPETGRRLVHLHCFETRTPNMVRHVAFRDFLNAHPAIAKEYEAEKARAYRLHPGDSHAYTDEKAVWVRRVEGDALVWWRTMHPASA